MILFFDLLGTFAFAVFGTNFAIQKKLDIFGVFVCAFLTAFGGGTIRSFLLAKTPFYFYDNIYVLIVLVGIVFGIVSYTYFGKIKKVMLVMDTIGLSTFALIGAAAAVGAGMGTFGIISLAVMNAVGGGIIRDAVTHELPSIFHEGVYATPAAILGLVYALFANFQTNPIFIMTLLFVCFSIRLAAIYWKANLWKPFEKPLISINKR